jgi:hypothetical protein
VHQLAIVNNDTLMVNPTTNQKAFTFAWAGQQHGKQCRNFTLSLNNHLHVAQSMDIKKEENLDRTKVHVCDHIWNLAANEKHENENGKVLRESRILM